METKEEFIEHINSRLTPLFTKDPEKDIWINERDVTTGGGVVVINGQRHEQPGETRHVITCVEVTGYGELRDVGKEEGDPFVQIDFYAIDGGEPHYFGPTFCMFYDDTVLFDNLINNFFGL